MDAAAPVRRRGEGSAGLMYLMYLRQTMRACGPRGDGVYGVPGEGPYM